mgnify:FL=1
MSSNTEFSPSTIEAIKCYVYMLTDDAGRAFYVGKGTGNRIFSHVNEVREWMASGTPLPSEELDAVDAPATNEQDAMGPKREKIAQLLGEGKIPGMYIVREGLSRDEALLVEAVLIQVLDWQRDGTLTNAVSGHGASAFGLKSVDELEATKGLPFDVASLPDLGSAREVIAINVNKRFHEVESGKMTLLDISKGWWKLRVARANECPYAIIHARGIVRGVFRIVHWQPSEAKDRYEFVSTSTAPLAGAEFSNRNIGGLFGGTTGNSQNPIRYVAVSGENG